MKALIYKDLISSKMSYILVVIMTLIFIVIQTEMLIVPFLFVYFPIILTGISFGADYQNHFENFVFTTPISRKTFVKSKYVIPLLLSIIGFILGFIIFKEKFNDIGLGLFLSSFIFALPGIILAIEIPAYFKYGAAKGRMIIFIVFFTTFGLMSYLGNNLESLLHSVQKTVYTHTYPLAGGILLIAFICLFLSLKVSIAIVRKQDF